MAQVVLDIGEAAGIIWHFLSQHGPTTIARLKSGTRLTEPVLHQGIGWLAREDKVWIEKKKASQTVALK